MIPNVLKNALCSLRFALAATFMITPMSIAPLGAQDLPAITDEMLGRTGAVLHVDIQTGRIAGVSSSGPVAEIGVKIVDVLFGDYTAGEWMSYSKRVDGEYVKPAVSQRLLLLGREGYRGVVADEEYSPASRDALMRRFTEHRRKSELLTGTMHVPDYLLRSGNNAVLHIEIQKSTPYDRGRGNLSATHTATVRAALQGDFKAGQAIEFIEDGRRNKRYDPPANRERIVLLSYSRSTQDGQMKWWLHERVNFGYTEAGFATLRTDVARVRAAQEEKAARDAAK
jgi:hypothetical protein